jgi:hypothetical protein
MAIKNTHSLSGSGVLGQINTLLPLYLYLAHGVSVLVGCHCQMLLLLRHTMSCYGITVNWVMGANHLFVFVACVEILLPGFWCCLHAKND